MTQRIKELVQEAKIQMCSEERLQEFAELIVQECALIINNDGRFLTYTALEKKIKKHFGIRE